MPAQTHDAAKRPKTGERMEVEIVDLNHDGQGVARTREGFVVFVDGAMPADRALVEVTAVHSRHGEARLVALVKPAPERIAPPCPVAGDCGGCALLHATYAFQLRWKEERVSQALARVGRLQDVPVRRIIGMERPLAYRNKAQYPVARAGGRVVVGFYRRRSHRVVPADECLIQHPLAVRVAQAARELIEELGLSVYDEARGVGLVRHVIARVSFASGECMAILVTRERDFPRRDDWIEGMRRRVPELVSLVQNVNPARTNVIMGPETVLLWGKSHLVETIGHREFLISPGSFFQVNPVQTRRLYDVVAGYAAVGPGDAVWDVYCGTGSIGVYVAGDGVSLRGVERVREAVKDAERNARRNGLHSASFEVGTAGEALPRWVKDGERADVIILDPPRSGSDPQTLAAVVAARPRRVVYVSCNPATLARDLAWLKERGYATLEVQPVDMFPQTPHVECVALISRTGASTEVLEKVRRGG